MNKLMLGIVFILFVALALAPAAAGENDGKDKEPAKDAAKDKDAEKPAPAEDVLAKKDEDLTDGFNRAKDWADRFMYAYACVKKNVKHKDAKDFYTQAFELEFDDYKQDVGTRLPYEAKEDKEYEVENFQDVMKDVKGCFLIIQAIKKKRKDIVAMQNEIKNLDKKIGEIVQADKNKSGSTNKSQIDTYEKQIKNKRDMIKRIEGEIAQQQQRFVQVGLARLKKGGRSKDKITSSFAKDAQKILEKIIQST